MHGYRGERKMNILEMTDGEIYELGFKALLVKLGASQNAVVYSAMSTWYG